MPSGDWRGLLPAWRHTAWPVEKVAAALQHAPPPRFALPAVCLLRSCKEAAEPADAADSHLASPLSPPRPLLLLYWRWLSWGESCMTRTEHCTFKWQAKIEVNSFVWAANYVEILHVLYG